MEETIMRPVILLENLRSCYNVGSIIRTADALGRDVAIVGYTPSPRTQPKVAKTSLGAEESVHIEEFCQQVIGDIIPDSAAAIAHYKQLGYTVIAAEVTADAIDLDVWSAQYRHQQSLDVSNVAVIVGNEVAGVEASTLRLVDAVVKIPMQGMKESLNVSQTAAMYMWELR